MWNINLYIAIIKAFIKRLSSIQYGDSVTRIQEPAGQRIKADTMWESRGSVKGRETEINRPCSAGNATIGEPLHQVHFKSIKVECEYTKWKVRKEHDTLNEVNSTDFTKTANTCGSNAEQAGAREPSK